MNESQGLAVVPPTPQAIEQVRNTAVQPVAAITRAELVFFGDLITSAGLVPPDKNVTPQVQKYRVMAKVVAGAAHGFDPISSQENLHIIQGRCVLSARGMAIKLRRTGKYNTRIEALNDEICTLSVWEKNAEGKWLQLGKVSFSYQDAVKAGLAGDQFDAYGKPKKGSNDAMYEKWRQDMLFSNAMKRVVRRCAPECLDTDPLNYRLSVASATQEQEPSAPAPADAAPSLPAPTSEVSDTATDAPIGEAYSEIPYTDDDATVSESLDNDGFTPVAEAEPVDEVPSDEPAEVIADPLAMPESPEQELARLHANAEAFLVEVAGSVPSKGEHILNGRVIGQMDKKQVVAFIKELEKIRAEQ